MKKLINLEVFKKMLKSKEKISSEIVQNPTKRKNNPISPSDTDLINAIDIPFIVLKGDNSIYFSMMLQKQNLS